VLRRKNIEEMVRTESHISLQAKFLTSKDTRSGGGCYAADVEPNLHVEQEGYVMCGNACLSQFRCRCRDFSNS
jgi:hypothetical protein